MNNLYAHILKTKDRNNIRTCNKVNVSMLIRLNLFRIQLRPAKHIISQNLGTIFSAKLLELTKDWEDRFQL